MNRGKRPLGYVLFGLICLAWLGFAPSALAQPCVGTTLSGPVAGNSTVTCDSGTTVVDHDASSSATPALDVDGTGPLSLINDGTIFGTLDFSGLTGSYVFDNNALWNMGGIESISDLGTGVLNNTGTMDFGTRGLVSAPGSTFTGTGDSLLTMGVTLNLGRAAAQASCSVITAGSCLDLTGGETAGQTAVRIDGFISNIGGSSIVDPAGVFNPGIVLIDVNGGVSADEHFVLDSGSEINRSGVGIVTTYVEDPVYGPMLHTDGLAGYVLLYDPNTQRHLLATVPQREAREYVSFIHEALSVWHTTSDVIAGRQADLRDGGKRGGWVRAFYDDLERDAKPTVVTHGNRFVHEQSYTMDSRGIIAGNDVTAGDRHVLGVHLGFMATRLEQDGTSTVDETVFPSSVTFGVYGGWWNDSGLTLDGTINANVLDIEHDAPDGKEDSRTNVTTLGVRAEAGWRFALMDEALYVQPLVTAAYAKANVDTLDLRFYDLSFKNEESERLALGFRLGGKSAVQGMGLNYWLTARAWEEYAEDGRVEFAEGVVTVEDDISDTFEEVGLGVSLTSADENLSVFLSGGLQSGDQTDSNNINLGARLNW